MNLPLPLWLSRKIVRRNPWLMADGGSVKRRLSIELLITRLDIDMTMSLNDKDRATLLAENAG